MPSNSRRNAFLRRIERATVSAACPGPGCKVPMFVVIYQDYIPRYGHELLIRPGDAFFVECASLFVEGWQPGRHMTMFRMKSAVQP